MRDLPLIENLQLDGSPSEVRAQPLATTMSFVMLYCSINQGGAPRSKRLIADCSAVLIFCIKLKTRCSSF